MNASFSNKPEKDPMEETPHETVPSHSREALPLPETCRRVQENLGAWIDGELPPEDITALEAHVRTCEGCQALASALREDWELLALLPAPPSGEGSSLLEGVHRRIRTSRIRKLVLWTSGTAAAAAIILGIVLMSPIPRPGPELEDAFIIDNLPVLEDLQIEARGLGPEIVEVLAELDPARKTDPEERSAESFQDLLDFLVLAENGL